MSTTETKACGMCHDPDCDQCFPPMTVGEFLRRLDVRKQEEQNVRRNPVLAVTVIRSLQAERNEAVALLREMEWVTFYDDDEGGVFERCIECRLLKVSGHHRDCRLGTLLGRLP